MKKLNKLFAILVAMAMMATLCVSMAFAEDTPAITGGTLANPAQATMTKTLIMPNGVTDPNKEYTFNFVQTVEATDADGYIDDAATLNDAAFGSRSITPGTPLVPENEGSLVGEYNNIFNGVSWPKAGVYEFTVTEAFPTAEDFAGFTAPDSEQPNVLVNADETVTVTLDDTAKTVTIVTKSNPKGDPAVYQTTTTEVYDYSQAAYKVYVGVATDNGQTYVESISVKKTNNDDGSEVNPATKVPATDPTNGQANGFNFTNEYNKSVNNTPQGTTPDGPGNVDGDSLFIEKLVTIKAGTTATVDADKEFRMNVTVAFPTNATKTAYTAKRIKADGTQVGTDYTFDATHLTQVIPLKTGERLVFTDIEYGATWKVVEDAYPAYATNYSNAANTTEQLVSDNADNGTKVTNEYDKDKDPATGLSIANLPFIVLALVAVGGLVAYIVVRRKSEDNA